MFFPFLLVFLTVGVLNLGKQKVGLILWLIVLLVLVVLLNYHATDSLHLSF
jgi:hypothetical protein